MATRQRTRPLTGWVSPIESPTIPRVSKVEELTRLAGSLESAFASVVTKLNEYADKINGRLGFGDGAQGSWAGNVDAQYIEVAFPGTPDTEQAIFHALGRTPVGYTPVRKSAACDIYDSSAGSWKTDVLYLKSTVADVTATLLVW